MPSFDIVSKVPWHEVDNATQQAQREIQTRFDFKGTESEIERTKEGFKLQANSEERLRVVLDCPPGLSSLTECVFDAADALVVPTIPSTLSLRALASLYQHLKPQRERGLHVLVAGVSGGDETPKEIVELSDIMLHSTDEAIEALETVARALGV